MYQENRGAADLPWARDELGDFQLHGPATVLHSVVHSPLPAAWRGCCRAQPHSSTSLTLQGLIEIYSGGEDVSSRQVVASWSCQEMDGSQTKMPVTQQRLKVDFQWLSGRWGARYRCWAKLCSVSFGLPYLNLLSVFSLCLFYPLGEIKFGCFCEQIKDQWLVVFRIHRFVVCLCLHITNSSR